jgi:hypothetical protein
VTLAPVWIVSDAGWNENPCITTVCDPALTLVLALAVAVLILAFDVAAVVVALTAAVVGLGLGLGLEVEAHPATSSGAATRTTIKRSRYFFTFYPFLVHIGGYKARGFCFKLSFFRFFSYINSLTELNER